MDISRVAASLESGRLLTGGWLKFFYFGMIFPLLLPSITMLMVIASLFVEEFWNLLMIISSISCAVFGLFMSTIFAYFISCNKKLKRRILLYLEDAIETRASTKTIDTFKTIGHPQIMKEFKIQVNFKIYGLFYSRTSGIAGSNKIHNGYDKVFAKYADRNINILYSPKYDQVLVLKDS